MQTDTLLESIVHKLSESDYDMLMLYYNNLTLLYKSMQSVVALQRHIEDNNLQYEPNGFYNNESFLLEIESVNMDLISPLELDSPNLSNGEWLYNLNLLYYTLINSLSNSINNIILKYTNYDM